MGYPAKIDRNKKILYYADIEGRTLTWIAGQLGTSLQNIRKIYHREKYKQSLLKQKETQA